jgi:hypothetical protein
MSKHTPGPWIFENRDGDHPLNDQCGWGCDGLWAVNGGFILGAGPGWDGEYVAPNDSDARLIAAAPDLLEALRDCREALRLAGANGELRVVDAAIAKATGEQV